MHLAWNLIQESIYILWLEKTWKNMQNGLHDKDIKHLFIEIGKCGHKILSVMPSLDDVVLSRNWYDSKLSCIKLVEWFTFSWKWGRQQFKFMIYNTRSYEKNSLDSSDRDVFAFWYLTLNGTYSKLTCPRIFYVFGGLENSNKFLHRRSDLLFMAVRVFMYSSSCRRG